MGWQTPLTVFASIFVCANAFSENLANPFANFTALSNQEEECRELAPGEERTVKEPHYSQSPTQVPRAFKVSRDRANPKQFNVQLKLVLVPHESWRKKIGFVVGEPGSEEKYKAYQAKYEATINSCFAKLKPYLTDEKGHQLNFQITTDPYERSVPASFVSIVDKHIRENSETWSPTTDCNTMVHEILHLTGLVDGYQEKWLRMANGEVRFNCRSIENGNSMMADSHRLRPGKDKPSPYLSIHHILAITRPRCTRDNVYMECAKNAYRSSSDPGGCLDVPEKCKDKKWPR